MKAKALFPAILAAVASLVTCDARGADPYPMGQPLPAIAAIGPAGEAAGWDDAALDALPAQIVRNVLARRLADQGALATRGPVEMGIYRAAAPAVVLIVTANDKLGTGSYLGNGRILTNWHVVGESRFVGVLFKPPMDGAPLDLSGLVRAEVVKTDAAHDLALIKLAIVPTSIKPLELGNPSEIQIGADVHAIGHPNGEAWTYTRGLISQIRNDYAWQGKGDPNKHRANVIQTQTPISPGSSGGPLLGDSGRILGVNSFKDTEGENLNFAISIVDIGPFLRDQTSDRNSPPPLPRAPAQGGPATVGPALRREPAAPSATSCKPRVIYDSRNDPAWKAGQDERITIDSNCDNVADIVVTKPADKSKPITALIDSNYDGKVDIIVEDLDRDGKWDISFHDTDFDGTIDLVGLHPDGKITPSRYITYKEYMVSRQSARGG
jgi:S1-C subfamily serine protease